MTPDLDFATKPTLHGQRVTPRPLRGEDVEAVAEILSDPQVRLLTGSVETTAEAHEAQPVDDCLVRWYATRAEQDDRLDLGIEDVSGHLVGIAAVDMAVSTVSWSGFPGGPGGDRR